MVAQPKTQTKNEGLVMIRLGYRQATPVRIHDMATGDRIKMHQRVPHVFGGDYLVMHLWVPPIGKTRAIVHRRGGPRPGIRCVELRFDGNNCAVVCLDR